MRQHPPRLKKAGISPARYAELQAICLQYGDYLNGYGGKIGERRARSIEEAAQDVAPLEWRTIMERVTEGRQLEALTSAPDGTLHSFYKTCLDFFIVLHLIIEW